MAKRAKKKVKKKRRIRKSGTRKAKKKVARKASLKKPKRKIKKAAKKTVKKAKKKVKAKKKATKARKAPKKKAARKPARRKATGISGSGLRTSPAAKPIPSPVSLPKLAPQEKIGAVTHYYTHLGVAVVRLDRGQLQAGDTIHVKGHTTDFQQQIESMEVEHQKIHRAFAGQEFGLKVIDHAREHDEVFKVIRTAVR